MIEANPQVLRWARETALLTPDEAAQKANLGAARGVAPRDRLLAFEAGDAHPTMPMLEALARVYRRPLAAFFLSHPPPRGDRGTDFRHVSSDEEHNPESPLLDAFVRSLRSRHSLLRDILIDEESPPVALVRSQRQSYGVDRLVQVLRDALAIRLTDFRAATTPTSAFAQLRSATESTGVFVLLASDLGSHHTAISTDSFRGVSIADPVAPLVAINDLDARTAWSFTLLHELTHILMGQTGYGAVDVDSAVERFCSDVASEFLLPAAELAGERVPQERLEDWLGAYAGERNISRSMVAYRLYRAGTLSYDDWDRLSDRYRREWLQQRETDRELRRGSETGPSYYTVRRHRLGESIIGTVGRALADRSVTSAEAGRILGINPKNLSKLIAEV